MRQVLFIFHLFNSGKLLRDLRVIDGDLVLSMPVDGPLIASEFIIFFKVCADCLRKIFGIRVIWMNEADE